MQVLRIALAALFTCLGAIIAQAQTADYHAPPLGSSEKVKRNDLELELQNIDASKVDFTDMDTSAKIRAIVSDGVGTGPLMFGVSASMQDNLGCTPLQVVRKNSGGTGFECASAGATVADSNYGDITVSGGGATWTVNANSVALGTDTTGNYVADVVAGTGIVKSGSAGEGWSPTIAFDYSDKGASPTLNANECVFSAASAGQIVCEGDTADANETRIDVTDPTADRTFTIPNADSVAVQPLTCSGSDKVVGISALGVVSCGIDVASGGGATLADGTYGDIVVSGSGTVMTVGANAVALTTDTTGNYVADVTAGLGLVKTGSAGEGWSPGLAFDVADPGADPVLGANGACFMSGSLGNLVFEGATNDAFESYVKVTDPTADRTMTIPNADSSAGQASSCASGAFQSAFSATTGAFTCTTLGLTGPITSSGLATTIAADAVALGTQTTGTYIGAINELANGIDLSLSGTEPATLTVAPDFTELNTVTWGAGAFTTMIFDPTGTSNPTMTAGDGTMTWSNLTAWSVGTTASLTAGTIELGNASDTTLARTSGGNVTVEGNLIYRAGGTDVPVADGGTGVSALTAYGPIFGGTTTTGAVQTTGPGTSGQVLVSNGASAIPTFQAPPADTESMCLAMGDETTAITTTGTKVTWHMPYALVLTSISTSVNTASTSGLVTVDVFEDPDAEGATARATILSTKVTIDANERRSSTAATPPVISDANLAANSEMTADVTVTGTGAKGLKLCLIGHQ